MQRRLIAAWLGVVLVHCIAAYYTSRRCYGTGDCHLMTKNQDGGFDDSRHQWLVECGDGEGAVAIRDDDTHFQGLSGLWCSFLFPLKQSSKGAYPYYPSCLVRNLSAGEYHCSEGNNHTTELFVSGIFKEPNDRLMFVPSLMKCCEMPKEYQIDYTRCYYKKTFDRFGEHYTGEWLVKCDTHHLVTGIGKDIYPWDNKDHFAWIQCCPFFYTPPLQSPSPMFTTNFRTPVIGMQPTNYELNNIQPVLNDPGTKFLQPLTGSGRTDYFPETPSLNDPYHRETQTTPTGPGQSYQSYKPNFFGLQSLGSTNPQPLPLKSFDSSHQNYLYNPSVTFSSSTTPYNFNQTFGGGIVESPPMNAIQYYANVAAYHQFIDTFNGLLSNYSKQQKNNPVNGELSTGPVVGGYTPLVYQQMTPPISLAAAMQTRGDGGYVQPPMPSGLQNYIALSSANPGATLSNLYSPGGNRDAVFLGPEVQSTGPYQPTSQQYETTRMASPMYAESFGQDGGYGRPTPYGSSSLVDLQRENQHLQKLLKSKLLNLEKAAVEMTPTTVTVVNSSNGVEVQGNGNFSITVPTNNTTP